jgi:hypothetical protein
MPIELYLGFLLLIGVVIFLTVILVFRLSNHDWSFDDE